MELSESTIAELQVRLRRVEGQVRGIHQMVGDQRDCRDIVTQLSAATKALEHVGLQLVTAGLTWCLAEPDRAAAEGFGVDDVQKLFLKLS